MLVLLLSGCCLCCSVYCSGCLCCYFRCLEFLVSVHFHCLESLVSVHRCCCLRCRCLDSLGLDFLVSGYLRYLHRCCLHYHCLGSLGLGFPASLESLRYHYHHFRCLGLDFLASLESVTVVTVVSSCVCQCDLLEKRLGHNNHLPNNQTISHTTLPSVIDPASMSF